MVVTGIVLAAIGGSNLAKPEDEKNDYNKDHSLQKCGYVVLLLAVLLLVAYSTMLLVRLRSQRTQRKSSGTMLLYFTLAALVFGVIRVAYGLASAVSGSPELSPVTGTFAVKFVLIFLVQLIATVLLVIGGLKSTDLRHETQHAANETAQIGY
jgi:membrane-associated HD superfamily phosphohydrolase